ncbi:MaoC/PaaZ C-terminal domain-containing protein [Microbacterium koreense]|uniref:MaoC/PaaZ C-terminal domain-containing protein n=1 Tax=Microbacterium koreense TaxID=323761 RepID=A0ABW2ZPL5_9MICO
MALDPSRVGLVTETQRVRWSTTESLLYALAVGAGQSDTLAELSLTTENTAGVAQEVLPSFAVVLGFGRGLPDIGVYDPTRAVHAEQSIEVAAPLTPEGEADVSTTVTEMWDKDPHAMVWTETELREPSTERIIARTRTGAFLGGAGGFGGERGPSTSWATPDRASDADIAFATRPDQALLYRLTGDRNPLHSDPAFAARGGFERPILHGMCTYGFATRLLLAELCGGSVARFQRISGRFARPAYPGDPMRLRAWRDDEGAAFQVVTHDGEVVIDRGRLDLQTAEESRDE